MEKGKTKRTTKLITVDSILTQENVKDTIGRLIKEQSNIVALICVYRDRGGTLNWKVSEGITFDQLITMLEQAKICLLTQEEED